jgi:hypothetical protein
MNNAGVTDEVLKERKIEYLKALLDKFAGLAMQSLMQHWLRLDESGFEKTNFDDKEGFISLAGEVMSMGWGSHYPGGEGNEITYADELANSSYYIAAAMLKWRLVQHDFTNFNELVDNLDGEKIRNEKATEQEASS